MRLIIEDLNQDGRGRGFLGKKTVLVSQALPGEEVSVRLDRKTRGTLQGRVGRFFEKRTDRLEHSCSHEFLCTGCPLLAASPVQEKEFKSEKLRRLLNDSGAHAADVQAIETPSELFAYRYYAKQIFFRRKGEVSLGSYVAGTHHVQSNASCPVLVPGLQALLARVTEAVQESGAGLHADGELGLLYAIARESSATGQQILSLATTSDKWSSLIPLAEGLLQKQDTLVGVYGMTVDGGANVLFGDDGGVLAGEPILRESLLGFEHPVHPTSFFQINPKSAARVFEVALDMAGEGDTCLEGYCGVGALTLPLSSRFRRVVAMESSPASVESLRRTALHYGLGGGEGQGIDARCGNVETDLMAIAEKEKIDVLLLNPPRKGLGVPLVEAINRGPVNRIVLVACGPEALARDLAALKAGGYRVQQIKPINQFPRTAHFETVVGLSR